MKFKVNKIVEAQPATKQEAEQKLGTKITNTLFGNQGYIINNKNWIPEEALHAQAVPFDSDGDILTYAIVEIKELKKALKHTTNKKKKQLISELNQLIKILES